MLRVQDGPGTISDAGIKTGDAHVDESNLWNGRMSSPEIALVAGQPTPQCTPPRNNGLLTVGFWVWYVSVGRLTKHEAPPSCFRIARKAWIVPAEIFSGVAPFPNALVIDKKHRYMNVTNKDIHK